MKPLAETARAPRRNDASPAPLSSRRPRVALFSGNYNYVRDGANQALNRLVGYLERRGCTVRVYSPTSPTPAFAPEGTLVSVPSVAIPGRGDYRFGLGLPRSIRADLTDFAPEIVHVSAPDWTGTAAQRMARRIGIPVVTSLHTRFEKYAAFYGASLVRPAMERHLARFYRNSDRILVPTPAIAEEFAEAGLADRTRLWGRGVDRAQFTPLARDPAWRRALGIADGEVAVLHFGRLVREKGLAAFASLCRRLIAEGLPIRPLVVGDGPERQWLEQKLPQARFAGHLMGADLGRAVASADLFLNPSTTEAFGNVTLEAMASGLPTVCIDVPSGRNLLHGGSGLLFAPGDEDGAMAALRLLVQDHRRRARMGTFAREASKAYDWDGASHQVLECYMDVLGRSLTPSAQVQTPEQRAEQQVPEQQTPQQQTGAIRRAA
ncbi:glycosyltransferase family 1 protein [Novosphingobium sp. TCA1]|uniref:glycosyltransferase family 4 protein n=1 Tax=Novosphingobium sp. TCA1 TaxID=2682474 RepID=UPI001305BF46|nr:glycosyltransferase family 1 protein [Novosphingobium sp. TCA1]GFE76851.1 glycosyl hydrolase [Novosphingobium sp. TCA1]